MKDLERQLKAIPTATPDDRYERRMDRLFLESGRRRTWYRRPIPLWQGLFAALVAVFLGYLYGGKNDAQPAAPVETTRTVYIVPASPEFQRAIQGSIQPQPLTEESGSYVIEVSPFAVDSVTGPGDAT